MKKVRKFYKPHKHGNEFILDDKKKHCKKMRKKIKNKN
jgi:hypothetical protein